MSTLKEYKLFKGLNNIADPIRLDLRWLTKAVNVHATSTGGIERRMGYECLSRTPATTAFSRSDSKFTYLQRESSITDLAGVELVKTTSNKPMWWGEVNNEVYYSNGVDAGKFVGYDHTVWRLPTPKEPVVTINSGGSGVSQGAYQVRSTVVARDGRESGWSEAAIIECPVGATSFSITPSFFDGYTSRIYITAPGGASPQYAGTLYAPGTVSWSGDPDQLGFDATTNFLDPLQPNVDVFAFFKASCYAAEFMQQSDVSVIWVSEPLGYHLFNLNSGFMLFPGRVLMLVATEEALIIGTDRAVFAFDGKTLARVALYGVIAGQNCVRDTQVKTDRVLFMSTRGVCEALPFNNLTEDRVAIPTASRAGGVFMQQDGHCRFIATLHGVGGVYNQATSQPSSNPFTLNGITFDVPAQGLSIDDIDRLLGARVGTFNFSPSVLI